MLNIRNLEKQIEDQMRTAQVPGLALAVVYKQEILYANGFGMTSVEDGGLPVTPQTLFPIGSTTKPLTGTAVMRLVESGKLNLDQPITAYVPWLTFSKKGAAERVTMRMLLSHTSGLPIGFEDFNRIDPEGLEVYVREEIAGYPLIAPPGKVCVYSAAGIDLAGYIAEVVTGQYFAELMQELVFDPLEMKRTTFDPRVAMTYPLAQSHIRNNDGELVVHHFMAHNAAHCPNAFAISTVTDLSHFAIMHMNQGRFRHRQILAPESVAEMHSKQVDLKTATGSGYGLTFYTDHYKGNPTIDHPGSIADFGSMFYVAPGADTAVIMLFNHAVEFWGAAGTIAGTILDQLLDVPKVVPKPQVVEPDKSLWPLFTGLFLDQHHGLAEIMIQDEQLILDWNGSRVPLQAMGTDQYLGEDPDSHTQYSVGFIQEAAGPIQYVYVRPPGPQATCRRIEPAGASEFDQAKWAAYTGTYTGEIFSVTVRITDGYIVVYSPKHDEEVRCIPLDTYRFAGAYGLIEFQVATDGTVPYLQLGGVVTLHRI